MRENDRRNSYSTQVMCSGVPEHATYEKIKKNYSTETCREKVALIL